MKMKNKQRQTFKTRVSRQGDFRSMLSKYSQPTKLSSKCLNILNGRISAKEFFIPAMTNYKNCTILR